MPQLNTTDKPLVSPGRVKNDKSNITFRTQKVKQHALFSSAR